MSFQRVVTRQLICPRGVRPFVLETLKCGHNIGTVVAHKWVMRKQFPPKVASCRERLCQNCRGGWQLEASQTLFTTGDVILTETYDLLSDIAKAYDDAMQGDADGSSEVPAGG